MKYLLREKIVPKLAELRMASLILVMYTAALRFEEAAAIDLKNIETLVSGNISITLRKGKMNQLAKDQVIILPKADAGVERDLDVTRLLHRYTTLKGLEVQSNSAGTSSGLKAWGAARNSSSRASSRDTRSRSFGSLTCRSPTAPPGGPCWTPSRPPASR